MPSIFKSLGVYMKTTIDCSSVLFSEIDMLRFTERFLLVASLSSAKIILIDHTSQSTNSSECKLLDLGHTLLEDPTDDFRNDAAVNDDGVVAITGDSKELALLNDPVGEVTIPLSSAGIRVKFISWHGKDYILLVEAVNVVRVIDWRSRATTLTIYPVPYDAQSTQPVICEVFFNESSLELLVVQSLGEYKVYDLDNIQGDSTYTSPSVSGLITGFVNPIIHEAHVVRSATGFRLANVTRNQVLSYDFKGVFRHEGGVVSPKSLAVGLEGELGEISQEGIVVAWGGRVVVMPLERNV